MMCELSWQIVERDLRDLAEWVQAWEPAPYDPEQDFYVVEQPVVIEVPRGRRWFQRLG